MRWGVELRWGAGVLFLGEIRACGIEGMKKKVG